MKILKQIAAIVVVVLVSQVAFGQAIEGSSHDFGIGNAWNTSSTNGLCGPCHIPHGSDETDAPLWSHDASTTTGFTMYSAQSGTMNASVGANPTGISLLCMGCHDGVIFLGAFQGHSSDATVMTGNANLGKDLSNDHPISFTYDAALATADGQLHAIDYTGGETSGATLEEFFLFGTNGSRTMECASCHDPHGNTATTKLLRVTNADSELCLSCHNK